MFSGGAFSEAPFSSSYLVIIDDGIREWKFNAFVFLRTDSATVQVPPTEEFITDVVRAAAASASIMSMAARSDSLNDPADDAYKTATVIRHDDDAATVRLESLENTVSVDVDEWMVTFQLGEAVTAAGSASSLVTDGNTQTTTALPGDQSSVATPADGAFIAARRP